MDKSTNLVNLADLAFIITVNSSHVVAFKYFKHKMENCSKISKKGFIFLFIAKSSKTYLSFEIYLHAFEENGHLQSCSFCQWRNHEVVHGQASSYCGSSRGK